MRRKDFFASSSFFLLSREHIAIDYRNFIFYCNIEGRSLSRHYFTSIVRSIMLNKYLDHLVFPMPLDADLKKNRLCVFKKVTSSLVLGEYFFFVRHLLVVLCLNNI